MIEWFKSSRSNPNGACIELASWRKSRHSFSNGGCAEVGSWRKSERSAGGGECVEAGCSEAVIGIRDTKQAHLVNRTVLTFTPAVFQEFTARIKKQLWRSSSRSS